MQCTGILLVRMKTNDKKIFGRWFEVMTAGTADKVALYWYAEPSVLTHMSWCGDYTHTHACTRTACTQHSHEHMHPRTHATLTRTHATMHACNTPTHTRMQTNCMQAILTRTHAPTHACNTHMYTRSHARTQHSHARTQHSHAHTHACMHTPHDQHTLSRSSSQPACACAHIRP